MKTISIILLMTTCYVGISQASNMTPTYEETVSYIETHGERIANQYIKQDQGSIRSVSIQITEEVLILSIFQRYLEDNVVKQLRYKIYPDNVSSISSPTLTRVFGTSNGGENSDEDYYSMAISLGVPIIGQKILKGYDDNWEEMEPTKEIVLKLKASSDVKELMRLRKALTHFVKLVQEREVKETIFD